MPIFALRTKQIPAILALLCIISLSSCAQKTIENPAISGPWLVDILTNDVGDLQTVVQFDVYDQQDSGAHQFAAYTEKNIDQSILGFWKARAGRVMGSNFKNGSLMRITKGKVYPNDSLSGILVTPFGNYYINATARNGVLNGKLTNSHNAVIGYVRGNKGMPKLPLHNYPAIIDSALALTQNKLYDPAILNTTGWKDFSREMKRISNTATDDAAFIMAFFYYSHQSLPFTHYALYRSMDTTDKKDLGSEKCVQLTAKSPHSLYMHITSFSGSAEEMDSAFAQIAQQGYDTLIVDLRDNSGGTVEAGMAFIRHLIPDTTYGGIFLTQKYFAHHTAPPKTTEYKDFPHFSKANFDLIIKGISDYPGICLIGYPQSPVYKGRTYILTNGNTASTCEPIVYVLKSNHLATIVGGQTAGAMLNGELYPIKDGFTLVVPTATYYTADGFKIDKTGVSPDIKVKADSALDYVLHSPRGQTH